MKQFHRQSKFWAITGLATLLLVMIIGLQFVTEPSHAKGAELDQDALPAPAATATVEAIIKEEYSAILSSALWQQATLAVCWDTPGYDLEKKWVRDAVERTWVKESALEFVGWQLCSQNSQGIRITVTDDGPHVKLLGIGINGMKEGMILNFTFLSWSPSCAAPESERQYCIEAIAVHEFGHAIGLTHEQNRDDAPQWCRDKAQGANPDKFLTEYDPESIMNYCNPNWNNKGLLSDHDIQGVRQLYGQPKRTILGNATYLTNYLDSGKVMLQNGSIITNVTFDPGQLEIFLTDPIAEGDINGDGAKDYVVALVSSIFGTTGDFYDLHALVAENNGYTDVATVSIGDRTPVTNIKIREDGTIAATVDMRRELREPVVNSYKLTGNLLTLTSVWEASIQPLETTCPEGFQTRLSPGMLAQVNDGIPNTLWSDWQATNDRVKLDSMPEGTTLEIIDGPECRSRYTWWRVRSQSSGLVGWTAESRGGEYYYLAPFDGFEPSSAQARLLYALRTSWSLVSPGTQFDPERDVVVQHLPTYLDGRYFLAHTKDWIEGDPELYPHRISLWRYSEHEFRRVAELGSTWEINQRRQETFPGYRIDRVDAFNPGNGELFVFAYGNVDNTSPEVSLIRLSNSGVFVDALIDNGIGGSLNGAAYQIGAKEYGYVVLRRFRSANRNTSALLVGRPIDGEQYQTLLEINEFGDYTVEFVPGYFSRYYDILVTVDAGTEGKVIQRYAYIKGEYRLLDGDPTVTISREMLANATIVDDFDPNGALITLSDGVYRIGERSISLSDSFAVDDVNGDGKSDAVIFAHIHTDNTTGHFYSMHLLIGDNGSLRDVGSIYIDDRPFINSVAILETGNIEADLIIHGPQDAMCCPSLPVSKRYGWQNGKFVEISLPR